MSSKSKIRGTRWESACRDWWNSKGSQTFRPALYGINDKGDIFGIDSFAVQCRDTAKIDLAGAVDDARTQAKNAGMPFFVAIIKRRRKGVAEAYAVMPLGVWDDWRTNSGPHNALGRQ